jgi:hypothetical protein
MHALLLCYKNTAPPEQRSVIGTAMDAAQRNPWNGEISKIAISKICLQYTIIKKNIIT